jgi:hypothetical protein
VTQDLTDPFFPLLVGGAGIDQDNTDDFGFFLSDPTQGIFAALPGFDGEGPGTIRIAQDVVSLKGSNQLVFDYECAWDMASFGATEDRTFEVNIEPSGGGAPLQTDLILTAEAGTTAIPSSPGLVGLVDVSAFAGQAVRISFDWFVPQVFTGPAFCQLDNVSVSSIIAPIPTLSEWGLIIMAAILGIVGFMVMRRRKATA